MMASATLYRQLRRAIPGITAMLVAAAFFAAERVPAAGLGPQGAVLVLPVLAIMAASVIAVALLHPLGTRPSDIVRKSATAIVLASSAYAHFLISGGRTSRLLILMIAAVLVFMYLREIAREDGADAAEDAQAFANLSYALHVLSVFFLSAFAFALTGLLQTPAWLLALGVGVAAGALTAETLRRHGISGGTVVVSAAYGILATESFWAITALSTPFTVNAAVFTLLYAFSQHVAIRALRSPEPITGLRRQVVASAILIAILLLTARWR